MLSPNENFLEIVKVFSANDKKLDADFHKVKNHLKGYADSRSKKLKTLPFVDVANVNDLVQPNNNLVRYLYNNFNSRYASETLSRIRRLLRVISVGSSANVVPKSYRESDALFNSGKVMIGETIRKNLHLFPRNFSVNNQTGKHTRAWRNDSEVRVNLNLTEYGLELLKIFVDVADQNKVEAFEEFFTTYNDQVLVEINKLFPLFYMQKIKQCYYNFRRKMGVMGQRGKIRESLTFDQLPEKLKSQCLRFIKNAQEASDPNSYDRVIAREYGIEIKKISLTSVKNYIDSILNILGRYKFDNFEELEVRDFLKLESREVYDEDDQKIVIKFNSYIEKIREGERDRETNSKRKGFDTTIFSRFMIAIKVVAAHNGIFKYHKPFNAVYKRFLDKESMSKKRLEKKQIFDIQWLDSEIKRLFVKYKNIVDTKSFIIDTSRRRHIYQSKNNLTFCFFYVVLVMLRYSGIRQQLIRNSKCGENISFDEKGNLKLLWLKDITKNNKNLTGFIDRKLHYGTHKILLETLDIYYRKIYPYARSISEDNKQDGFFFYLKNNCKTMNFSKEISAHLGTLFSRWGTRFLNFRDRLNEKHKSLNAHVLRGLCADWLHFDLKVSRRSTADFIGDIEETLVEHYLDFKNSHSMTPALDEANNYLKLIKS